MKPLTPKQVAERANVSLSLVYAVLHAGKLRTLRIGCRGKGKWLIEPEDFENWKATCKVSELAVPDGELKYL